MSNEKIKINNGQLQRLTIGFLGSLFFEDYVYQISEGIVEAAKDFDVNLLCFDGGAIRSPLYYHAYKNALYDLVSEENMDGIIALSESLGHHINMNELKNFFSRFTKLPFVSIGVMFDQKHSIIIDNKKGMRDLLTHFIEKHGAERIAFMCGPKDNPDAVERFQVYKEVLIAHSIPFRPELVTPGDFTKLSGKEAIALLLDERRIKFDTLIGSNDYMAISAMQELMNRGIRVPQEVRVGGFDNAKISCGVFPTLTTVGQPMFDLGYKAIESMVSILLHDTTPENIQLPTTLIIRRSCGCVGPYDIRDFDPQLPEHIFHNKNLNGNSMCSAKQLTDLLLHSLDDNIVRKIIHKQWIKNIVVLLFSWIDNKSDNIFMVSLESIFLKAITDGNTITDLYTIVSTLFTLAISYCTPELSTALNDLKKKIAFSIGPITERIFLYLSRKTEERDVTYKRTSLRLISTKGIKPFLIEELMAKIESIIQNREIDRKKNIAHLGKSLMETIRIVSTNKESKKEYFHFQRLCEEYKITKREIDVLTLLLKGLLNKEIGYDLKISQRTVNTHIYNMYKKFHVQTRIELVNKFKQVL